MTSDAGAGATRGDMRHVNLIDDLVQDVRAGVGDLNAAILLNVPQAESAWQRSGTSTISIRATATGASTAEARSDETAA